MLVSSKKFLDIQAIIEFRFTLNASKTLNKINSNHKGDPASLRNFYMTLQGSENKFEPSFNT